MKAIFTNQFLPRKPRILNVCAILGALTLLPSGLAAEKDFKAVQKRLYKSVKKGEISKDDAEAMMAVLKKRNIARQKDKDLDAIGKKIEAAVAAGEITKEEARKKYAALKKEAPPKKKKLQPKRHSGDGGGHNWEMIKKRIENAVKDGSLTREQADAKYRELKKTEGGKKAGKKESPDLKAARRKLKEAVEAGKLTEEEAAAKWKAMRKESGRGKPTKK